MDESPISRLLLSNNEIPAAVWSLREFKKPIFELPFDNLRCCFLHCVRKPDVLLLPGYMWHCMNDDRRLDLWPQQTHLRIFEGDSIFILEQNIDKQLLFRIRKKSRPNLHRGKSFRS